MHKNRIFFSKYLVSSKKSSTFAADFGRNQTYNIGAVVQLVRIHACHAWGRGFESRPHREEDANASSFVYLNNYQNKNHPLKVAFTLFITDESKCF